MKLFMTLLSLRSLSASQKQEKLKFIPKGLWHFNATLKPDLALIIISRLSYQSSFVHSLVMRTVKSFSTELLHDYPLKTHVIRQNEIQVKMVST